MPKPMTFSSLVPALLVLLRARMSYRLSICLESTEAEDGMMGIRGRYGLAVGLALTSAVLRFALDPFFAERSPFLFFLPAVLGAALWLGSEPALMATVTGLLASLLLFIATWLHFVSTDPTAATTPCSTYRGRRPL